MIYIWIVILGLLWLKWTIGAIYNLLLYISYHHIKGSSFWRNQGRPQFDSTTFEIWFAVHLALLFIVSLALWLERVIET